jgi:2-hydroxy-6-oxonona-2,4-dienedioate hydrolase
MTAESLAITLDPTYRATPEGKMLAVGDGLEMWTYVQGEGRPLVFVCGGGGGATSWVSFGHLLPLFSDRQVIFVDPLCYGRSSAVDLGGPFWTTEAKYVAVALEQLGVQDADFVGTSQGSSIALAVAAANPGMARSVVVTGAEPIQRGRGMRAPEFEGSKDCHDLYYGGEGPTSEKMRDLIMAPYEWYDGSRIGDGILQMRYEVSLQAYRQVFDGTATLGTMDDLEDRMRALTIPVLFLYGKYDPFVTYEYLVELLGIVPNSEIFLVDQARHHAYHERPETYGRVLRAFLDARDAA